MYDYYVVLGGSLKPYEYLKNAIEMINQVFSVVASSKFYLGPSEDPNTSDQFMNVALYLTSSMELSDFKFRLNNIEMRQLNQNKKIIDIDLLVQKSGNEILYVSPKIKFCHCMVTLKDVFLENDLGSKIFGERPAYSNAHLFVPIKLN